MNIERELDFTNAVMQAQLDASPLGILVVDADDRVYAFNARFVAFFDPPASFAKGASDREMLATFSAATVDPEATFDRIRYLYAHPEESADDEIRMKDGRIFERHSTQLRPTPTDSVGRIWFFSDVTAERAATCTAEQERNIVTALLDSLPGYFVQIDGTGRLVRWNESLRLLNGLSDEDIMGSDPFANVVEADRSSLMLKVRQTIVDGSAEIEFHINTLRGIRTIRWQGRRITVDGLPQVLAVGLDVTDIRAVETSLRASEERFRIIFESANDGIIVHDLVTGRYIDVNPRACEMFGYTREEFLALDAYSISAASASDAHAKMIPITTTHKTVFFEWLCRAKDGHEFWTDNASRVVRFRDRDVFLSTIRDVTERRKASAEISYRDRLLHTLAFSTAELVKGASHESSLSRVLEALGHQLAGDRLLIVQLSDTDDPTVRYTWQRANVRLVDVAELAVAAFKAGHAPTIRAWLAPLREGKPVVTKFVDETGIVRAILEAGDVVSAVFLPIFVNGAYWGYFSVDDTGLERDWTPIEMEALKTFADVIGATLAREQAETSLKRSEEQFRTVSATVLDGIIMIGKDGRIRFWNPSAARIFGYTATEAQGQAIEMLAPERFRRKASRRLAAFFAKDDWPVSDLTVELTATRKDGTEIAVELAINSMRVGVDQYAVGIVRDVTARKSSSELMERLASHDALTGLPNRRWFMAALDNEIARARRSGETFAVLYMDLDNFKDVNDRLGHPAGDNLLLAVAQRLTASVREVDTVARFGGDEFAAIQSNVRDPANAELLARKIVLALGEPFTVDGTELQSSTSLGIAVYSPESPDGESLLAHADVALYLAKSEGRGTYRFYTDAMEADIRVNTALIADLRKAIALRQFFLLYEPRVDRSGRIIGLEATPHWQHPERGVLEPAQFMAAAEKSGLINPLGGWVIREACRQTRAWIDEGVAPPYIAMIVSEQQFKVPQDAHETIEAIIVESGVPPAMLELELRESGLTEAASRYKPALLALLALGVHITIDDFGNGYSSLEVLRSFPIWRIKIPRNFIVNLNARSANAPLVRATLSLARELGIPVIAEGVETEAQATLLSAWGCKEMQGSYFAKPLAADKMSTLLRVGKIRPVPAPSSARTLALIYDEDGPPAGTPAKQT